MNPLIVPIISELIDIIIGALTKHPEYEPHLGPLLGSIIPVLSQAVGETPEQTAGRRAVAEAIFAKWSNPIVASGTTTTTTVVTP